MSHHLRKPALALALAIFPTLGLAGTAADAIKAVDPYARAVPEVVPNSAVFLKLENSSDADHQLVAAGTDVAQTVELHTHINDDGVMRMRRVMAIDIPAGGVRVLEPGGLHIMLLGLHQPLEAGQQISLQLEFSDGSSRSLKIPVREIRRKTETNGKMHHHH